MTADAIDWSFFSMAKYLLAAHSDETRVMGSAGWEGFLERLREAGQLVAGGPIPAAPVDRASAFRGLAQLLYFGLERTLGSADPARPVLSRPWPVHLFDYGAGNPDAVYRTASLRDEVTYRLSGTLGNAAFMSLEFFDGVTQAGSLRPGDLRPDDAGRFELILGPRPHPGHWLEIVPGTGYLLTREFFDDWADARPSELRIECLDEPGSWPIVTADRVERELEALGTWLVEAVKVFSGAQAKGIRAFPNAFDPHVSRPESDLPAIYHGYWDLGPDDALLVEVSAPADGYWGIQTANGLWITLDFANRHTSLNRTQACPDDDGALRVVVAHRDPGIANWLDTLGHRQGVLTIRFTRPGACHRPRPRHSLAEAKDDWMSGWADEDGVTAVPDSGLPRASVVPLAKLDEYLPPSTARVDPAERRKILDDRLRQITRLQRS
jgi:hypothetical protein